jgi:hypothetical protein
MSSLYVLVSVLIVLVALLQLVFEAKTAPEIRILQVNGPQALTPSLVTRRHAIVVTNYVTENIPWLVRCMFPWTRHVPIEGGEDDHIVKSSLQLMYASSATEIDIAPPGSDEYVRVLLRPHYKLVLPKGYRYAAESDMYALELYSTPALLMNACNGA